MSPHLLLIDDRSAPDLVSCLGTRWRLVSDTVMGGVSQGRLSVDAVLGRPCLCLQGEVSLANNGGFVQASLDLSVSGFLDAGAYRGIELDARGNGGRYNVPLRTADTRTPRMQFYDCENGRLNLPAASRSPTLLPRCIPD